MLKQILSGMRNFCYITVAKLIMIFIHLISHDDNYTKYYRIILYIARSNLTCAPPEICTSPDEREFLACPQYTSELLLNESGCQISDVDLYLVVAIEMNSLRLKTACSGIHETELL